MSMIHDDDEPRGNIAPKKGIPKLRELIAERKAQHTEPGPWQPVATQRLNIRAFSARLVEPDQRTPLQKRADERHDVSVKLDNTLMLDMLSIRVTAIDRKHQGKRPAIWKNGAYKGRLVECWIRGVLLRRIIEKPSPNRTGMNYAKYSIAIAFLCGHGIAEPLPSGANGYRWTAGFKSLARRAEWLIDFVKREGEMRKMRGPQRYQVLD